MATKTMILRPIGWYQGGDESSYSPYPQDITEENYYLLLSEENADDSATYLITTIALNMNHTGCLFNAQEVSFTPSSIRLVFRACTTISGATTTPLFFYGDGASNHYSGDLISLTEEYTTYTYELPSDNINTFWSYIKESEMGHIGFNNGNSNSKGDKDTRITQLYLEIDYDDGSKPFYLKKTNAWEEASYTTVYKKNSNSWVITDALDKLTTDTKMIIKEV